MMDDSRGNREELVDKETYLVDKSQWPFQYRLNPAYTLPRLKQFIIRS